jgi:topoisomerase-4 subunit A
MEGLDEDAVDLRPNYDGTLMEPVVLPAPVPHLLANGASGIAVGMATSIPPHNMDELIGACLLLIAKPQAPGRGAVRPDRGGLPTGACWWSRPKAYHAAVRTGRGSFRLRARWEVEDLGRGTLADHW